MLDLLPVTSRLAVSIVDVLLHGFEVLARHLVLEGKLVEARLEGVVEVLGDQVRLGGGVVVVVRGW